MIGISRASSYRWRAPPPSFPVEMELRDAIQRVALEFPADGYRRITFELNRRGFAVTSAKVDARRQPAVFAAQVLRCHDGFAAQPAGVSQPGWCDHAGSRESGVAGLIDITVAHRLRPRPSWLAGSSASLFQPVALELGLQPPASTTNCFRHQPDV